MSEGFRALPKLMRKGPGPTHSRFKWNLKVTIYHLGSISVFAVTRYSILYLPLPGAIIVFWAATLRPIVSQVPNVTVVAKLSTKRRSNVSPRLTSQCVLFARARSGLPRKNVLTLEKSLKSRNLPTSTAFPSMRPSFF